MAFCPKAVCSSCGRTYSGWSLAYKETCECGGKLLVASPYDVIIGLIHPMRGKKGKMKPVTPERYAQVLNQHKDEVYHLALDGWQMPILHGLIALAADHPGVKKLGWPAKAFITQVRWWCREKFGEWGFSPEEVEYLDKMREEVQHRGEANGQQ